MRFRSLITAVLLLFVGASVFYLISGERRSRGNEASTRDDPAGSGTAAGEQAFRPQGQPGGANRQVVAFYFHGNTRCPTCRAIEAYTEEALKSTFPDELRAGKLVWLVINIEEPGNEHYVDDYQLTTRSVVLVEMQDGNEKRWRRLDKVWQLVHDRETFVSYISDSTRVFLAGS